MCSSLISDCGSKYHKTTKFLKGTMKKIIPYRPTLNNYDANYKTKYPIEKYMNHLLLNDDWEKPWGKLTLNEKSDLLVVDAIYYPGVQE